MALGMDDEMNLCRRTRLAYLNSDCRRRRKAGAGRKHGEMRMGHLRVMLSVFAAGLVVGSAPILAQGNWSVSGPVFGSDLQKKAEQEEAERAARRKSYAPVVYPKYMEGGERPDIKPSKPPIVYFDRAEEVGSIIIDTQARKLYYVLPDRQAYEYPISVGREGFTWTGTERISRIASWPSWTPPPEMHERVPGLPITVSGGIKNPQGARALYLGSTIYRIHGTNNDRTVGRANSSGCFRLTNEHVVHLASIAKVGTKVRVLKSYAGGVSQSPPISSLFDFGFLSPEPSSASAKSAKQKKAATAKKSKSTATSSSKKAAVE
jgi:lipoprotein-anchoring transpeptidase ErfK/SrfK